MNISEIVDEIRYPIAQLDSPRGKQFVQACQQQLRRTGACLLPGFISPAAIESARLDGIEKLSKAHQVDYNFAYDDVNDDTLAIPLETLPADHPRHHKSLTRIRFLARDILSEKNPMRLLHAWPGLREFIEQVMQQPTYPSACPLSSCILTVAEEEELQDWHFDGVDFIVTLMLEKPDDGGAFEYVTGLRKPDQEDDYDGVSAVFEGRCENIVSLPIEPGTLTLFRGKFNLHRAAPVARGSRRMMAVLSYEREPDQTGSEDYLRLFYGRSLHDLPCHQRLVHYR